ncbi:MAG: Cytidine and deoxycytidylate deaminase zinc-binding region, partial [Actinomycetota bacterium]
RPNPWVGAVVVSPNGEVFTGSTLEPGNAHAEVVALSAAGKMLLAQRCIQRLNHVATPVALAHAPQQLLKQESAA